MKRGESVFGSDRWCLLFEGRKKKKFFYVVEQAEEQYLVELEDGLGSGSSVEILWDELNFASSSWDFLDSVSILSSWDHVLGPLSSVWWAGNQQLDLLVLVGSVLPSADKGLISSLTRNVSDSVELVDSSCD
jgi:hypothetical protein